MLCGKLAATLHIPPNTIYRELVKDVGDNYEVVPIREDAVDAWIANWGGGRVGWICDVFDSKIDGYVNVRCFYGSSTYDTAQMARLIDLLVAECKENGVETLPPEELERMCGTWGEKPQEAKP